MNRQSAIVVIDKAKLPELVHEMTDPRPGRADHLRQVILTDSWEAQVRLCFPCQNEQAAGESEPAVSRLS